MEGVAVDAAADEAEEILEDEAEVVDHIVNPIAAQLTLVRIL